MCAGKIIIGQVRFAGNRHISERKGYPGVNCRLAPAAVRPEFQRALVQESSASSKASATGEKLVVDPIARPQPDLIGNTRRDLQHRRDLAL